MRKAQKGRSGGLDMREVKGDVHEVVGKCGGDHVGCGVGLGRMGMGWMHML